MRWIRLFRRLPRATARVDSLVLSPDGSRLVATVSELDEDGDRFVSALWELDPAGATSRAPRSPGRRRARRAPAFHPDGSVLFVSGRDGDDDEPPALWRLPAVGEAERVLARPGGVAGVRRRARQRARVVVAAPHAARRGRCRGRREAPHRPQGPQGQRDTAHRSPVRYWDHDLGPDEVRLLALADGARPRRSHPRARDVRWTRPATRSPPTGRPSSPRGTCRTSPASRARSWSRSTSRPVRSGCWPTSPTASSARRRSRATARRWCACACSDASYDDPPRSRCG